MARQFWIRCDTVCADGDSFDAFTARTRIQTNGESVYEEARNDQCVIMRDYESPSSTSWMHGPHPVLLTKDRDLRWRTPYIAILVAKGNINMEFQAVITPEYYRPRADTPTGPPNGSDPFASWLLIAGSSTVPTWQTAKGIVIPQGWFHPHRRFAPDSTTEEEGVYRLGWLTFWIQNAPGATLPKFCGYRLYEYVQDEDEIIP